MTTTINIGAVRANQSKLVDQAAGGGDIVITRRGKPVARLTALEATPKKRKLGRLKGKMRLPDFIDDPLPDWLLDMFEGRAPGSGLFPDQDDNGADDPSRR
jgi:prevent-host-death family protein